MRKLEEVYHLVEKIGEEENKGRVR